MEDNKYYVPEPEEFHPGFEFEMIPQAMNVATHESKPIGKAFKPVTYGPNLFWAVEYTKEQLAVFCRVKYLDREDIESLGWKLKEVEYLHGGGEEWFLNGLYMSQTANGPDKGKYYIHNGKDMEENEGYFFGYIKNKSELKRILTQIGINEKEKKKA